MNIGDHLLHSFIENSNALCNILPGGQWHNATRGAYGKILVQPTIVAVAKKCIAICETLETVLSASHDTHLH